MVKHYTGKQIWAVILINVLFIIIFIPISISNFIKDSNMSFILYLYVPIIAFILPIITMFLQQKFHHKFGYIMTIVFISDVIMIVSLLVFLISFIQNRLNENLSLYGNIIPYYLFALSIILLITHIEIFRVSFRKYHKVKIMFLNSPL